MKVTLSATGVGKRKAFPKTLILNFICVVTKIATIYYLVKQAKVFTKFDVSVHIYNLEYRSNSNYLAKTGELASPDLPKVTFELCSLYGEFTLKLH